MHTDAGSLETIRDLVSARLATALEENRGALAHIGTETEDVFDAAAALLTGGKRLRAAFCAAGWSAAGGPAPADERSPAITAGASMELFQAAALVHDDVMDGSLTRRGQPAAHRRFAGTHSSRAWLGEPDAFGEAAAILLGDLLLVMSFGELARALREVRSADAARAQHVYDVMTAEVTLGQYLDMQAQAAPWDDGAVADLDRAQRVLRAKSARYSVEHPTVLGAAMAGGPPALLEALHAFGLPIGEAFQLRDDVLGVFGDPDVTGKPAGDDLREGKRTLLVALTVQRGTPAERRALDAALGNPDMTADELTLARAALVSSGALATVEDLISERAAAGLAALEDPAVPRTAFADLAELAGLATERVA